jgi:hypothetical protein
MKNTWLYKQLQSLLNEYGVSSGDYKSSFLEAFVTLTLAPIVFCFFIFLFFVGIILLPLYLIKDFIDLYYHINAEKIEAKRKAKEALEKQQKVEDYIEHYQHTVDCYPICVLKQFKIKEEKKEQSNQIEDNYIWPVMSTERITPFYGSVPQVSKAKYPTIRRRESQESMRVFNDTIRQEYFTMSNIGMVGIADSIGNDSYLNAKNDRNKEYVELTIEEVQQKHKDYIEFIKYFITDYNFNCDTFNSKTGTRVCSNSKRRSAFDIYLITKYYYNHVTFQDVLFTLIDLVTSRQLYTSYCGDVQKYVYYTNWHSTHNRFDRNLEFSSELTFEDLINYKQLKNN